MKEQWKTFLTVFGVSIITGAAIFVITYLAPEGGYSMAVDLAFIWFVSGVVVGYVFGEQKTPPREIILVMIGTVSPVIVMMLFIDVLRDIFRKLRIKLKAN